MIMFSSPIQYGIVNNKFQFMDLPVNFSLRSCLIGFTDMLYRCIFLKINKQEKSANWK